MKTYALALTLMLSMAPVAPFADRLDRPDPIAQAYSLALQRPPTATERAAAEKLLARHGKPAFCRALLNSNALIFIE